MTVLVLLSLGIVGCQRLGGSPETSAPLPTGADLPATADEVVLIRIAAFPEGPVIEFDRTDPEAGRLFALLPDQLPEPSEQPPGCAFGGVVTLQLDDGGQVDYGPCIRPAEIETIRQEAFSTQP
jgi:hypothetical protein